MGAVDAVGAGLEVELLVEVVGRGSPGRRSANWGVEAHYLVAASGEVGGGAVGLERSPAPFCVGFGGGPGCGRLHQKQRKICVSKY